MCLEAGGAGEGCHVDCWVAVVNDEKSDRVSRAEPKLRDALEFRDPERSSGLKGVG